jgi:hypothetical protein
MDAIERDYRRWWILKQTGVVGSNRPGYLSIGGPPTQGIEVVPASQLQGAVEALREIVSGPDASKGESYGCLDLHEARTIARDALDRLGVQ